MTADVFEVSRFFGLNPEAVWETWSLPQFNDALEYMNVKAEIDCRKQQAQQPSK